MIKLVATSKNVNLLCLQTKTKSWKKMKKVFRCLGMMALLALAITSCKKQEQTAFKASVQDFVVVDEDRAYVDGQSKIHFEVGDRLMIFNISVDSAEMSHCATYKAIEDGNHVEFVNSGMGTVGVALDDGYYAYYPSSLVQDPEDEWGFISDRIITELEGGENKAKFYVAPEQQYRPNMVARKDFYLAGHTTHDEAPNLAIADFQMKSICGVWKLQPYDNAQRRVTKIEITDPNMALSGWVELIIPELDYNEMMGMFNNFNPNSPTYMAQLAAYKERIGYSVTDGGNTITLNLPAEGVQLGKTRATTPTFSIVLRPAALMRDFDVVFTFSNGQTATKHIANGSALTPVNTVVCPNTIKSHGMNLTGMVD
jgi:hypothetical protein